MGGTPFCLERAGPDPRARAPGGAQPVGTQPVGSSPGRVRAPTGCRRGSGPGRLRTVHPHAGRLRTPPTHRTRRAHHPGRSSPRQLAGTPFVRRVEEQIRVDLPARPLVLPRPQLDHRLRQPPQLHRPRPPRSGAAVSRVGDRGGAGHRPGSRAGATPVDTAGDRTASRRTPCHRSALTGPWWSDPRGPPLSSAAHRGRSSGAGRSYCGRRRGVVRFSRQRTPRRASTHSRTRRRTGTRALDATGPRGPATAPGPAATGSAPTVRAESPESGVPIGSDPPCRLGPRRSPQIRPPAGNERPHADACPDRTSDDTGPDTIAPSPAANVPGRSPLALGKSLSVHTRSSVDARNNPGLLVAWSPPPDACASRRVRRPPSHSSAPAAAGLRTCAADVGRPQLRLRPGRLTRPSPTAPRDHLALAVSVRWSDLPAHRITGPSGDDAGARSSRNRISGRVAGARARRRNRECPDARNESSVRLLPHRRGDLLGGFRRPR